MRRLALLVLLLLAACGLELVDTALLPRIFLPLVIDGQEAVTDPDKGVALGTAPCEALALLGAAWYYSGPECEGHERVPYLDGYRLLERAPDKPAPDGDFVLFLNECDGGHFSCPPLEEQVVAFVAAEKAWPGKTWVGPCSVGDPEYVWQFWAEYARQTDHLPDKADHRLCLHCYSVAAHCLAQVERHLGLGVLDRLWLTEFGLPLGLDLSIRQAMEQNAALVNALDADPRVERWAYWPADTEYGWSVPSRPISGFHPLTFQWRNRDGTIQTKRTDMGEMYSQLPGTPPTPGPGPTGTPGP